MKTIIKGLPFLLIGALLASPALAHPGHDGGLAAGLLHPLSGLDHLSAMLAVGLWAATRPAREAWRAPALFVAFLAIGAGLGVVGGTFGPVETMIAGSVSLLGVMLIAAPLLPNALGLAAIGAFALLHGYAHGAEAAGDLVGYFAGFMTASALLHASGWGLGRGLFATRWGRVASGVALAVAGIALATG